MRGVQEGAAGARAPQRCTSQKRLVLRYINAVTSAMRTSPRWSQAAGAPNAVLSSATTSTMALSLTRAAQMLARSELSLQEKEQDDLKEDARSEPASVGLLGGFTVLRAQLRMVSDVAEIPLPTLLSHFIGVILSPRTTGAVTQVALEAVAAFLDGGLFRTSSIGLEQAVQEVAHATSHCRFEPSDAGKDEVVLLAILDVMYALVRGRAVRDDDDANGEGKPFVDMLGDESVCELMETCLSMGCQTRLSSALRRTAERKMQGMIREVFSRLQTMPLQADEAYTETGRPQEPDVATLMADRVGADAEDDKQLRMATPDPKSRSIPAAGGGTEPEEEPLRNEQEESEPPGEAQGEPNMDEQRDKEALDKPADPAPEPREPFDAHHHAPTPGASNADEVRTPTDVDRRMRSAEPVEPFGMPALKEILRVLISLLDPGSVRHTMTMRLLGLSLLGSVLDTHGAWLARFPSLRALLGDSACRYLFQLANSEYGPLVAHSLRVLHVLFVELRGHLKMQQELLLQFYVQQLRSAQTLVDKPWSDEESQPECPPVLASFHASASGEQRELFTEALCHHLAGDDDTADPFVVLWRNYDCDMDCANLYDHVTQFLCRAIFAQPMPGAAAMAPRTSPSGLQLVALDMVLGVVERMAARHESGGTDESGLPSTMRMQRERKALLAAGAAAFNHKPKDGIAFLAQQALLAPSGRERARSIARFLKDSPLVDKRLLGDYISRAENVDVLAEYMDMFDFGECDVAEAMRALCEAFRLPGEAQQIARITETFARKYFASKPPGIRSEDAVYVLAYSIIMLNTDLHNPQVTRRMTTADYQRNLRGVNDGADFDQAYLAAIYDGIRRREIVMPEEHAGQLGFDYAWKELLRRARAGNTLHLYTGAALDADMFRHSWRPFVASIVHAFSTLQDEHLLHRVIAGCRQCVVLARAYDVPGVLDYMVEHLASATGLMPGTELDDARTDAVVEHDGTRLTVSPLSVAFGSQFKQQLAAVVLFTIAHGSGASLRSGWSSLLACIETLLVHGLLPRGTAQMYVARDTYAPIPLTGKGAMAASTAPTTAAAGGLFSTLSSYFLSPYPAASEPMHVSDADLESTLCALDCLASCKIHQMHSHIAELPDDALAAYVAAVYERLGASVRLRPDYSPVPVFWLEQLTTLVCTRPACVSQQQALDVHLARIKEAPHTPPTELERATLGAMRIAAATDHVHDALMAVLDALRSVPSTLHATVSAAFLTGLVTIIERGMPPVSDDEWRTLLHLVTSYARVRRAATARAALELVVHMVPQHVQPVTYAALVELVRETLSDADRAMWHGEDHAPRRTLTEKRELSEWMAAVHAASPAALEALARVRTQIPSMVAPATWPEYWLPLVTAFAQPCVSVHAPTRHAAVSHLPYVVLAPEMHQHIDPAHLAPHMEAMFGHILLPLLETLMAPETTRADTPDKTPPTIAETRALVCLLVIRAWVRNVGTLMDGVPNDLEKPAAARVLRLWIGVVHATAKLLRTPQPHSEAIDEQLKNMVLVMHTAGHLVEGPPGSLRRALWVETWRRIDPIRPDLRASLQQPTAPTDKGT